MPEDILKTIVDLTGKRRVLIVRRENGDFGFEEEEWSDEPMEQCWIRFGQYPFSICDSEETAVREAYGRIKWLEELKSTRRSLAALDERSDNPPSCSPSSDPPENFAT